MTQAPIAKTWHRQIVLILAVVTTAFMAAAALAAPPDATNTDDAPPKQVQLTEAMIQGVINAQPDIKAFADALPNSDSDLTKAERARLKTIANKHGFKTFNDLDDATTTISFVLASIDAKTGAFIEPKKVLESELAAVKADPDLEPDEKKFLLEELTAALASNPRVEHPSNIDLVRAFKDDIGKALE